MNQTSQINSQPKSSGLLGKDSWVGITIRTYAFVGSLFASAFIPDIYSGVSGFISSVRQDGFVRAADEVVSSTAKPIWRLIESKIYNMDSSDSVPSRPVSSCASECNVRPKP